MNKDLHGILFMAAFAEVEKTLAEASGPLMPIKPELLERLAGMMRDALKHDDANTLDKLALEKGHATVALMIAAAEFRRAAERYAWSVMGQVANSKLTPKADAVQEKPK